MQENSWREAIIRVLGESDTPLHYTEITEQILGRGYRQGAVGATPAATVRGEIGRSINQEAEA